MLLLIGELLFICCGVLLSIWWRRPSSRFQRQRVPYRGLNDLFTISSQKLKERNEEKSRNEAGVKVTGDFVVIGGGPGGLAAARTLLNAHPSANVIVIESGRDPLPCSTLGRLLFFHSPVSFPLFHMLRVKVYKKVVEGWQRSRRKKDINKGPSTHSTAPTSGKGISTLAMMKEKAEKGGVAQRRVSQEEDSFVSLEGADWSYVAARPFCCAAAAAAAASPASTTSRERKKCSIETSSSSTSSFTPPSSSHISSSYVHPRSLPSRPSLLDCSSFPQGRGLGGTALCGWGVALPSVFRQHGMNGANGMETAEKILLLHENGGGDGVGSACEGRTLLPSRVPPTRGHPISSAYSSVLVRTKGVRKGEGVAVLESVLEEERGGSKEGITRLARDHHFHTDNNSSSKLSKKHTRKNTSEEAHNADVSYSIPQWRASATSPQDRVVWSPRLYMNDDNRSLLVANSVWSDNLPPSLLSRLYVIQSFTVTGLTYEEVEDEANKNNTHANDNNVEGEEASGLEGRKEERQVHSCSQKRFRVQTVVATRKRLSSMSSSFFWDFIPHFFLRKRLSPPCLHITVEKGVVLSAGLVGTPLLLSLSLPATIPSCAGSFSPLMGSPSTVQRFPGKMPFISHDGRGRERDGEGRPSTAPCASTRDGTSRVWWCRDAVGVPLIYKANAGVTLDDVMAQALHSPLLFTLRSLFLETPPSAFTCFSDLICSIPLMKEGEKYGPHAELLLFVLPFGARNDKLFYPLGVDMLLGSYRHHAVIFYIVLTGIEGLAHGMNLESLTSPATLFSSPSYRSHPPNSTTTSTTPTEKGRDSGCTTPSIDSSSSTSSLPFLVSSTPLLNSLSPEVISKVREALSFGIRFVRECAREAPLSLLLQGEGKQEAIDFTLLHEDPGKAKRFAQLMYTSIGKMTLKMKKELVELAEWGHGIADQDEYIKDYLTRHTKWMGFGSGTSEGFLECPSSCATSSCSSSPPTRTFFGTHSFFVKGVRNMVVGDCSAISRDLWKEESFAHFNALLAGNIATAVDAGILAAHQLSRTFPTSSTLDGGN